MEHNVKRLTFGLASLILLSATSVWAATVVVGTCMPTKVSYDSLTDAIAGVPAGSTTGPA